MNTGSLAVLLTVGGGMPNSKLKCNSCGERFPRDQMKRVSGVTHICKDNTECHIKYAVKVGGPKVTAERERQKKERLQEKRVGLRRRFWYVDKAEESARLFVHQRDYNCDCHSCGSKSRKSGNRHAGHYRPKGGCEGLRLNLFNIAIQCGRCNNHKSGAVAEFRIALINRYGIKKVEDLEGHHPDPKHSREYLERYAKIFRKRARLYKRLREKREAIAA